MESVAILSDVHGVLLALERVLAEPLVADADLIVVAGDHVWGPQPAAVLDRLAGLGDSAILLRGNADREILHMSRGLDVGLGDDPVSVWGASQLASHHRDLIRAMAQQVTIEVAGFGPVRFCHATPRGDDEVVLVDSNPARWAEVFAELPDEVQTVVCGHTHMPFVRLAGGRLVVNPGSVGLPYGRAGAHWALLRGATVSLGCTPIDPDELVRATVTNSDLPNVAAWADANLRVSASDIEALTEFALHEGR